MQIESNITEGKKLFAQVKANFIAKETTFAAWCREQGYKPSNARSAFLGNWNGPKGRLVRKKIIQASGLKVRHKEVA